MPMKNPPHPGRSIRNACLEPLGLSVTEGAEVLGVTRQTLNNVVNGKSGISPEMAIRLSKAFGSTPETWLKYRSANWCWPNKYARTPATTDSAAWELVPT